MPGGGQHTAEARQTQRNPQHPKLPPKLPNWGKHLRLPGKLCKKFAALFKERINWGAQTNAKIITAFHSIPIYFFFPINAATVLNKQHSACSIQAAVPSQSEILLQFMEHSLDAMRNCPLLLCTSFRDKFTFWSTPVKEWAIPSFPSSSMLIQGKESWQLLNYSINVVGFPTQHSFLQTFCTSEDCTYLRCPHTEIDCSSVESAGEERLTQDAKGIIKGAAQPGEAQVCES